MDYMALNSRRRLWFHVVMTASSPRGRSRRDTGAPTLRLDGLRLSSDTPPLNVTVHEGECLALLALSERENGLSRFADVLSGRALPADGRVFVAEKDVTALLPAARGGAAVVGRHTPLFGHMTVRDNIGFPFRAKGLSRAAARQAAVHHLALLGLERHADAFPADLAPDIRIRVAFARALATDPAVIVLNDVFAGLDGEMRRDLRQRLDRLRRARMLTLLLLTRDREEALTAARRIGVLADGVLLQLGDAGTLIERPACPRVAVAMGDANLLVGAVMALEDDVARVRLACGAEMEALADPDLEEGDLVDLCVRPDQISPLFLRGQTNEEAESALGATLTDIIHLGDVVQLRFRLAEGTEINVHRPPASIPGLAKPGADALLAWQPMNAMAFPTGTNQE